jgi:hypothetical protein
LPGILGLRCGQDTSGSDKYTHALVVSFKDLVSLEKYMTHPEHKKILQRISSLKKDWLYMDFEDHN